jgi:predicted RNA-binding protein with RPS1 domain
MSERAARRRWQREHRKQLLDEIQVGETRTGTVRSLSEFGAFVDLGGADGLVHISELAWFPVAHPSEVLKVGQQVDVKVLRIDKQRERVGLSLKRVQPDPWSHIDELYQPNQLVEAVVTRVTDFGAFVRLRSGVEGLLHVSEMADIRPDHPQSLVSPGDLLLLRVLRIEPDRRRIGLSLRQVSESEWSEWAASYREKQAAAADETAGAEEGEVEDFASDTVARSEMDQFAMVADELPLEEEAAVDLAAEDDFESVTVGDEELSLPEVEAEAFAEPVTVGDEELSLPDPEAEALAEPVTVGDEELSLPEVEAEALAEPVTVGDEELSLPEVEAEAFAEPVTVGDEELSLPEVEAEAFAEPVTVGDEELSLPEVEAEIPAEPKTLSGEESSLPEGEVEVPAEPENLGDEETGMTAGAEDEQSNA